MKGMCLKGYDLSLTSVTKTCTQKGQTGMLSIRMNKVQGMNVRTSSSLFVLYLVRRPGQTRESQYLQVMG